MRCLSVQQNKCLQRDNLNTDIPLFIQISCCSVKEEDNKSVNKPTYFASDTNLHHQLFATNGLIWLRSECGLSHRQIHNISTLAQHLIDIANSVGLSLLTDHSPSNSWLTDMIPMHCSLYYYSTDRTPNAIRLSKYLTYH